MKRKVYHPVGDASDGAAYIAHVHPHKEIFDVRIPVINSVTSKIIEKEIQLKRKRIKTSRVFHGNSLLKGL